jgi:hypothetical protein
MTFQSRMLDAVLLILSAVPTIVAVRSRPRGQSKSTGFSRPRGDSGGLSFLTGRSWPLLALLVLAWAYGEARAYRAERGAYQISKVPPRVSLIANSL